MEHFRENPAFIEQLLARVESLETQVQTLQKQLRRVLEIEVETDTARLSCDSLTVRRGDSDAFLHAVADADELYFGLVDGRDNNLELRLPLGEAAESSPSIHLYSAQNLVARMGVGEMGGEFVTLTRDQQPRTVAKATEETGIFAVLDDEGLPRAVVRNTEDGGLLEVLSSEHVHCGGISAVPDGAALMLQSGGENADSGNVMLAATSQVTSLVLGSPRNGINLMHSDQSSFFHVVNPQSGALEINTAAGEAYFCLKNARGTEMVRTGTRENLNYSWLANMAGEIEIDLQVQNAQNSLIIGRGDGRHASVFVSPERVNFALADDAGRAAILCSQDDTHSNLLLCRENSAPHLVLQSKRGAESGEGAVFTILEERHHLVARATPETAFVSLNQNNENVATLASHERGGSLELRTAESEPRVHLQGKNEGGFVHVMGETGGSRISMGVAHDHGQLALSMSGGDIGVALGTNESGGHVMLCDDDGQPVMSLPESENESL